MNLDTAQFKTNIDISLFYAVKNIKLLNPLFYYHAFKRSSAIAIAEEVPEDAAYN